MPKRPQHRAKRQPERQVGPGGDFGLYDPNDPGDWEYDPYSENNAWLEHEYDLDMEAEEALDAYLDSPWDPVADDPDAPGIDRFARLTRLMKRDRHAEREKNRQEKANGQ